MVTLVDNAVMETATVGPEDLAQRVAVLRRFRALLEEQRERFRSYLEVLDKQQDIIENGSANDLLAHVELEEQIVADIFSIQKVIEPLDDMYRAVSSSGFPAEKSDNMSGDNMSGDNVLELKAALEDLRNEAVVRSSRNRELLSKRMVEIRSEIQALRNNPYAAKARFSSFGGGNMASLVDIEG